MKQLVFAYEWSHNEPVYGHEPYLRKVCFLKWASEKELENFQRYLCSALQTDLDRASRCDRVLAKVREVEEGMLSGFVWEGDNFLHHIGPGSSSVRKHGIRRMPRVAVMDMPARSVQGGS